MMGSDTARIAANPPADSSPATDEQAFEALYERWSASVYRYLVHFVGPGPLAEDLFQETWLKAVENRDRLRQEASFGPWVLRIARNLAFNQLRTRQRRARVWVMSELSDSDEETGALEEQYVSSEPGPRERTINRERREIVTRALSELDLVGQEVLQLRYFEHLGLADIAQILDLPLGTVCTKVHRSLRVVRSRMEAQGYTLNAL